MAIGVYGRLVCFVLIARNHARVCLLLEALCNVTQVVTPWLMLPVLGMRAAGVSLIARTWCFRSPTTGS
jgi:hypothetical protein